MPVHKIRENLFKRRLNSGVKQAGLWLTLESPTATEVLAGAGYPEAKSLEIRVPNEVLPIVGVPRGVNYFLGESVSHCCVWLQFVSTL